MADTLKNLCRSDTHIKKLCRSQSPHVFHILLVALDLRAAEVSIRSLYKGNEGEHKSHTDYY